MDLSLERTSRDLLDKKQTYWITTVPEDVCPPTKPQRGSAPLAVVEAINPLAALDAYAVQQGFIRYSDLDDPENYCGWDTNGMWGIMTNTTIWAIEASKPVVRPPIPPEELRTRAEEWVADLLSHDNDLLTDLTPATDEVVDTARKIYRGRVRRPTDTAMHTIEYEGMCIVLARNGQTGQLIVNINTEGVAEYDQNDVGHPRLEVALNDVEIYDYDQEAASDG